MQNTGSVSESQAWVAIYALPFRAAIKQFDDEMLRVWLCILTFADNRGIAFPGVRKLQEITGLRAESVTSALDRLESAGFICFVRRNERDPVTGRLMPNIYAVPESLVKVKQGFDRASDPHLFRSHGENLHNQNHLLDLESTTRISDPTSVTNSSGQAPVALKPVCEAQRPKQETVWSEFEQPEQPRSAEQGTNVPHITPPVSPPSLRAELIERMRRAAPGLSARMAGTLIDRNGVKACLLALEQLEAAQAGKIDRPAGWLVSMCYRIGDYERRRAMSAAGD
jgi:hypothetical protein